MVQQSTPIDGQFDQCLNSATHFQAVRACLEDESDQSIALLCRRFSRTFFDDSISALLLNESDVSLSSWLASLVARVQDDPPSVMACRDFDTARGVAVMHALYAQLMAIDETATIRVSHARFVALVERIYTGCDDADRPGALALYLLYLDARHLPALSFAAAAPGLELLHPFFAAHTTAEHASAAAYLSHTRGRQAIWTGAPAAALDQISTDIVKYGMDTWWNSTRMCTSMLHELLRGYAPGYRVELIKLCRILDIHEDTSPALRAMAILVLNLMLGRQSDLGPAGSTADVARLLKSLGDFTKHYHWGPDEWFTRHYVVVTIRQLCVHSTDPIAVVSFSHGGSLRYFAPFQEQHRTGINTTHEEEVGRVFDLITVAAASEIRVNGRAFCCPPDPLPKIDNARPCMPEGGAIVYRSRLADYLRLVDIFQPRSLDSVDSALKYTVFEYCNAPIAALAELVAFLTSRRSTANKKASELPVLGPAMHATWIDRIGEYIANFNPFEATLLAQEVRKHETLLTWLAFDTDFILRQIEPHLSGPLSSNSAQQAQGDASVSWWPTLDPKGMPASARVIARALEFLVSMSELSVSAELSVDLLERWDQLEHYLSGLRQEGKHLFLDEPRCEQRLVDRRRRSDGGLLRLLQPDYAAREVFQRHAGAKRCLELIVTDIRQSLLVAARAAVYRDLTDSVDIDLLRESEKSQHGGLSMLCNLLDQQLDMYPASQARRWRLTLGMIQRWLTMLSSGLVSLPHPRMRESVVRASHLVQTVGTERMRRDIREKFLSGAESAQYMQMDAAVIRPAERRVLDLHTLLSRIGCADRWRAGWDSVRSYMRWWHWLRHPVSGWRLWTRIRQWETVYARCAEQVAAHHSELINAAISMLVHRRLADIPGGLALLHAQTAVRSTVSASFTPPSICDHR